MSWIVAMTEWAVVLDVIRIVEASRTGIELTIDVDMSQAVAMEACFVKMRMTWG